MFFVECKPDFALVSKLTESPKRIEHSGNKVAVLIKLTKQSGYQNSTGLIDEDPHSNQPKIIKDFAEKGSLPNHRIRLLHYQLLNNRVLVLCPRLEEWILEASREAGVNVESFGLPSNAVQLHETVFLETEKFERLIEVLAEKSSRVKKLKQLLQGQA